MLDDFLAEVNSKDTTPDARSRTPTQFWIQISRPFAAFFWTIPRLNTGTIMVNVMKSKMIDLIRNSRARYCQNTCEKVPNRPKKFFSRRFQAGK